MYFTNGSSFVNIIFPSLCSFRGFCLFLINIQMNRSYCGLFRHNLFLLSVLFTLTLAFHIYVSFVLFPFFKNFMVLSLKTYTQLIHMHTHTQTCMHTDTKTLAHMHN